MAKQLRTASGWAYQGWFRQLGVARKSALDIHLFNSCQQIACQLLLLQFERQQAVAASRGLCRRQMQLLSRDAC